MPFVVSSSIMAYLQISYIEQNMRERYR